MSEKWYDKEIAPLLVEIGKKCEAEGIPFLAVVEYEPHRRGSTTSMPANAGLEMRMLEFCAQTGANIDAYIITLIRYCRLHSIPVDSSIVMSRMGSQEHL